jgi:hypothetical protein
MESPNPGLMLMLIPLARRISDDPTTTGLHQPMPLLSTVIESTTDDRFRFVNCSGLGCECGPTKGAPQLPAKVMQVHVPRSSPNDFKAALKLHTAVETVTVARLPQCRCPGYNSKRARYLLPPELLAVAVVHSGAGNGLDSGAASQLDLAHLPTKLGATSLGFLDGGDTTYFLRSAVNHLPKCNHYTAAVVTDSLDAMTGATCSSVGESNTVVMDDISIIGLSALRQRNRVPEHDDLAGVGASRKRKRRPAGGNLTQRNASVKARLTRQARAAYTEGCVVFAIYQRTPISNVTF